MNPPSAKDGQTMSLLALIENLRQTPAWVHHEGAGEIVQTHISALLLGCHSVLKFKKPVNFGFLDYSTLELRRRACEAEVHLNRRLCPQVYLGVQPIIEKDGELRLSGEGHLLDFAVRMKRLPAEKMLDRLVARGTVSESIVAGVARRLTEFHRSARRGPQIDIYGGGSLIGRNWNENFTQTAPYIGRTISTEAFESIRDWVEKWLAQHEDLLEERVRNGRICDGHGDVRCESVCVSGDAEADICIFDCIEFNDRFRCGDVAGEAAFLAMDLDARGRPDLGYYFTECYAARAGDSQIFRLLPFYRCYRAFVRGKVLSFRLDEPEFSAAEKQEAATRAAHFFDLASRYASPLCQRTVIAVAGLSGTGKSSVARAVAGELGMRVVSSDAVRKSLFAGAQGNWLYGEGPYSADANLRTYQAMNEAAQRLLLEDNAVVLDATFRRAAVRDFSRRMAASAGAKWRLIECRLSDEKIHSRLSRRAVNGNASSDANWDTYLRQREEFEAVNEKDRFAYLALSTDNPLAAVAKTATDWLRACDKVQT